MREGIRYVAGRPDIQLVMFIVFMLGTFGMNFQITNALMATEVYGKGADAYGILGSIMAVGSLTAALMAARRPRPRLSTMLGALMGFAIATFALALAPTYEMFILIPVGLTALTVMTTANASVQLTTEPVMRGRVMALYMMIFLGGTPLGAPMIGWIGDARGARWTVLIGAITARRSWWACSSRSSATTGACPAGASSAASPSRPSSTQKRPDGRRPVQLCLVSA